MYKLYLVTGATGNLGSAVIRTLLKKGGRVRALILPDDPQEKNLPEGVEVFHGSVEDRTSLSEFFSADLRNACVIHCAGLITIASRPPAKLMSVNVDGTRNVMELCLEKNAARVIYVSSVHAIPENKDGTVVDETDIFSQEKIRGSYAKSKSAAKAIALGAAQKGLNVSVVFPSGILGPFDRGRGNVSATILAYCRGKLPAAVRGGYDFVDVRDVADGIVACAELGRAGECYILSGHYATLRDILESIRPLINGKRLYYMRLWFVKMLSPFFEFASLLQKKPMFLTPYSAYVMGCSARFSSGKAEKEFGYSPRSLHSTLVDIVLNFKAQGLID